MPPKSHTDENSNQMVAMGIINRTVKSQELEEVEVLLNFDS